MKRYKVGICGNYGSDKQNFNGQSIKTDILTKEFKKRIESRSVGVVDTSIWKKKYFKLLFQCIRLLKKSTNIVLMPAQNGIKILIPLFVLLNLVFKKDIYYIVIGGWLPDLLIRKKHLRKILKKIKIIYVETNNMKQRLESFGFQNVDYLPNFKKLDILDEQDLSSKRSENLSVCTFSRVSKEKGIEDAIKSVVLANEIINKDVYSLDIYGQIDVNYKDRFKSIMDTTPNYIKYKGVVEYNQSTKILKNYFLMLFPTYYQGEGFAGTIIDAFSAGLPVIATNWKYNAEIIRHLSDGIIYNMSDSNALVDTLVSSYNNQDNIFHMKKNCVKRAHEYTPEIVVNKLMKDFSLSS